MVQVLRVLGHPQGVAPAPLNRRLVHGRGPKVGGNASHLETFLEHLDSPKQFIKTYVNNSNFNLYQDDESLHVLCGKTQRQLQEVGVATDGKLKVGIIFYFCTIKIKLLYLFCCTCEEIKAHRPKASDGISLSSTRLEGNADEFNVVAVDEA